MHQWRLYKRYSTPIDVTNLRPSRLFLFQIVFQLLLPATALATVLLQVYGYRGPVCGVEVLTLVTMLLCWSISCVLTSLERSAIDPYNFVCYSYNLVAGTDSCRYPPGTATAPCCWCSGPWPSCRSTSG